jgi:hypothetical protein
MEQRANIKFCFKTGKTATETFQLIKQTHGNNAPLVDGFFLMAFEWFKRFKTDLRIYRMIQEAGVLRSLEMQTQSQMSAK